MNRLLAGGLAGILAGIPFGLMMQLMSAPTPDGGRMPMMTMVAMIVRSQSPLVGWLYHLFNSAVIGAIFAALAGSRIGSITASLGWGAGYGMAWWVIGGLVLMPLLLGMSAFAPLTMHMMRPVALGSLAGHVLYGLVLGAAFFWLAAPARRGLRAGIPHP